MGYGRHGSHCESAASAAEEPPRNDGITIAPDGQTVGEHGYWLLAAHGTMNIIVMDEEPPRLEEALIVSS
jgi:hypothetical protein